MASVRRDTWRRWLAPLPSEAKLVALFLLTSEAGGVFPVLEVSEDDIATSTGIPLAHVGLALDELRRAEVAFHEGGLAYLAVLVHERPLRGPKQARGARARFDHLPDRPITRKAFLDVVASLESGTVRDAFAEPPPSWWDRGPDERGNRVFESGRDERTEARDHLHARACSEEAAAEESDFSARARVARVEDVPEARDSIGDSLKMGGDHHGAAPSDSSTTGVMIATRPVELFPKPAGARAREEEPAAEVISLHDAGGLLAAAIERHAPELVDAIFVRVLEADWARIPINERVGADVAVAAALQLCDAKGGRHRGAFRIALREVARREPLRGSQ
jgi:hypothetical protein